MAWAAVAIGAATILANLYSQQQQTAAYQREGEQQRALSKAEVAERRRQFDIAQKEDVRRFGLGREAAAYQDLIAEQRLRGEKQAYQPYTQTGEAALGEYQALLGLSGEQAAREAESRFKETPGQRYLREKQEKALLRNSAAIGGLGGGNVRTALQEQAAGIAQTQRGDYLDRLKRLTEQGLQAGMAGGYAGTSDAALTGYEGVRAENLADRERRAAEEAERKRLAEEAERKRAEEAARLAAQRRNRGGLPREPITRRSEDERRADREFYARDRERQGTSGRNDRIDRGFTDRGYREATGGRQMA
jgi:hypothetical protein